MDKDKLKKRILRRFKKKLTGRVKIKIGKKRLTLEYMYGGKYCLKKWKNGNYTVIEMLGDVNKIVDLLVKEKTRIY